MWNSWVRAVVLGSALGGCDGCQPQPLIGAIYPVQAMDLDAFEPGAIEGGVQTIPCVLSNGASATCHSFRLKGTPVEHPIGPFCPRHISDDAERGGIWLEGGQVHEVTGDFVSNLDTFYGDPTWKLYDEATGEVRVTRSKEACLAAARPDVDPEYQHHCVECDISYIEDPSSTILIPAAPVRRARGQRITARDAKIGISLGGVVYDPPAPVHAILGAHTLAPFDDCGGHVNPHIGYHYHAATGCSARRSSDDGHAPLIGYAMDGFGLYAPENEDGSSPSDLDGCGGHEDRIRGYHYHVAKPGENRFIQCFAGEIGRITE